jgi:3-oxoadipate enol-lactonase
MPEVEREDVRLWFVDEGGGRPALLLHGHTLDHRVWNDVTLLLRGAGLRLVRFDLRGHGQSLRPDSGYHWCHHAADAVAILDHVGLQRAVLVGFSLGGGVVLEMAITNPERVDGLVLVAPVMPDRPFEEAFMNNLREVARVTRSEGIRAAMLGPWLGSPLFAGSFSNPGLREQVLQMVSEFPGADYLAVSRDRIERSWTVPERLGEIAAPSRVVVGSLEMPGFAAFAREAAESIPGAVLEVVEAAGHLLPLESPDAVARAILAVVGTI